MARCAAPSAPQSGMYNLGILVLFLVFAATLWGGVIVGPDRLVPFLIFTSTLLLPAVSYDLPSLPDIDKITAVTMPTMLLFLMTSRERWSLYRSAWPDLFLYLFVAWATMSVLINQGAYPALSRLVLLSATLVVPYVAGRLYLSTTDDLTILVRAVAPIVVVYLGIMAVEARTGPILGPMLFGVWQDAYSRAGIYRPVGLAYGSLELGHYMVLVAIVFAGTHRGRTGLDLSTPRLLGWGTGAAILGALMSVSRGPITGLALGFLPPMVLRNTRGLGVILGLIGIGVYLWMLSPNGSGMAIAEALGSPATSEIGSAQQTLAYRFMQIDAFKPLVEQKPLFGHGESWTRTGDILIIDGILLIYTLGYGYVGMLLMCAFWLATILFMGRSAVRGNSPFAHIGHMLAPVIGWLTFSAWGDSFLRQPHLLIMGAVIGGMYAERRLTRPVLPPLRRAVYVSG